MRPRLILILLCSLLLVGSAQSQKASGGSEAARPERAPIEGARIFQNHCAACHGPDGRGHGPASVALKSPVPDLTLISRRNGGKFPALVVKELIEGKQLAPSAHGNREMPVWGPIFHEVDADQDWGEVRLDAITRQLEFMQRK